MCGLCKIRNDSPIVSKHFTNTINANPGKTTNHQFPKEICFAASDRIIPMDGCCADKPNPKNVMEASCKIT